MEALLILFVIGFLGVVLIGSILGLTSSGRMNKLEQQNRNLNQRVKALEAAAQRDTGVAGDSATTLQEDSKPAPTPAPKPIVPATPAPELPTRAPVPVAAKSAPPPQKPIPAPKPIKPKRNLEEIIGGQWSVWVGGLALLVGAVLLIRFSIEAGFFGPTARIAMAGALGTALLLAGEWLKRSDEKVLKGRLGEAAKALQGNASVPALLSAVGIFTLLGASYAAHALYDLIPALAAFAALAVISVGAMVLSLRQGQLLAGIGLLASLATPLLIQTETPSLLMLVIYLVLVGGAALVLSRKTGWGWLATGTVFGWLGWSLLSIEAATTGQLILWSVFLAFGFGVTVWFAEGGEASDKDALSALNLQPIFSLIWSVLGAILVVVVATDTYTDVAGLSAPIFTMGMLAVAALIAASLLFRRQSAHLVVGGLLALAYLLMANAYWQSSILMGLILIGVLLAFRNAHKDTPIFGKSVKLQWSVFAVLLGLASVAALDIVESAASADKIHAAAALGFAGLFAGVSLWFRRQSADWIFIACPVIGAGLGWALAAALGFEDLNLSLALSLGAALAALTIWRMRLPGARFVLLGLAGLVFAHALLVQFPNTDTLSTRPILNALWVYLALPTAILGASAFILHRREESGELAKFINGVIEAAALAGLALFAVFQIRHLSNAGQVYTESLGHAELGLQVSVGLCFTLAGLSKRFAGNLVLSKIAEVISYITLAGFAIGSLYVFSPLFQRGETITGNLAFNSLTTGLLVPTVLLSICAVMARGRRPEAYINSLGGLALAGALSWVTALIRFVYNGDQIQVWTINFSDMELWTISAVWLAFGIALLALGVWRRERALRIASGLVIILTVLKAFLIDMAGLEGVLRALSFVALGLVLIVIGRAYQRYWLSDSTRNQPSQIKDIGEEE